MTAYLRQIITIGGATIIGFALFVLLSYSGVGSSMGILFYRGVILSVAAALATAMIAHLAVPRYADASLPVAAFATVLSVNLCFLVLLPVTVDRSISVYLLATIDRAEPGSYRSSSLQHQFIAGYVDDLHAIDRRIAEQKASGNLVVGPDGSLTLTAQGRRFLRMSRVVAELFHTDPHFVAGAPPKLRSNARH